MIRAFFLLLMVGFLGAGLLGEGQAWAHDSQPLLVQIDEQSPQVARVSVKLPPSMEGHIPPSVIIGPGCKSMLEGQGKVGASHVTSMLKCDGPLPGRTAEIAFGDFNPSLAIVFRYQPLEGPVQTSLQAPDELKWQIPALAAKGTAGFWMVMQDYVMLGIEHILLGFDHLLFVMCLVLLAGSRHRILLAITGFTLAHSVTLGLSALGVLSPPVMLVEALIALSIVFLAAEIARQDRTTIAWRYPIIVSIVFGLLHGFGFAAALGEIGLPTGQRFLALFAFNLGVELGQIFFVLALVAVWKAFGAIVGKMGRVRRGALAAVGRPVSYAVGVLAMVWFFERIGIA